MTPFLEPTGLLYKIDFFPRRAAEFNIILKLESIRVCVIIAEIILPIKQFMFLNHSNCYQ